MGDTVLDIIVVPRSSRHGIVLDERGVVKVYLNSPPVEGRANAECISLFSKKLHIGKSRISIEKGEKGRNKIIRIQDISPSEVFAQLKKGIR